MSPNLGHRLVSLANYRELSLAFCEDGVLHLLDRAKPQASISLDPIPSTFVAMQLFGEQLLVLYERSLVVVEISSLTLQYSISLETSEGNRATSFCHPSTYINKIIITFSDGTMQLINIKSKKVVHTFKDCKFDIPITCITASPIVDIVAVGLHDGSVWICDVKKDLKLFMIGQGLSSKACAISFRSDMPECNQLVVGYCDGRLTLWNLERRTILDCWRSHEQSNRHFATFVQGQPLIVSSAGDNSIKQWIIEEGRARLLKFRSGHSAPPTCLQFYGDDGSAIISTAPDKALRITSLIKDSQSTELSQGSIDSVSRRSELTQDELKLNPIKAFGAFTTKVLKWDNLVSVHENSSVAHTWRVDHRKLGEHELRSRDGSSFNAVCMSQCGNYVVLGCDSGSIDVFNVQSGHHRRHIAPPGPEIGTVIGLGVDSSNSYLVVVHDSGKLCCYELRDGRMRFEHDFAHRVSRTHFYADGELMAVTHPDDFTITLFDIEGRQVVRRFKGHLGMVNDMVIASNGKWLISSSLDETIRVWDIALGLLISTVTLPGAPIAITLSPTLTHLAVALEGDVAIYLWTNLSLYRPVTLLPTSVSSLATQQLGGPNEVGQLNKELLALSLEPRNKFLDIFHIEEVSARSRPQLSAKMASKKTPFFLDSLLAKRSAAGEEVKEATSKDLELKNDSHFTKLVSSNREEDWDDIFSSLRMMSPGQASFEISALVVPGGDGQNLLNCLQSLECQLRKGSSWEIAVVLLEKAISCHATFIKERPEIFGRIVDKIRTTFEGKMCELEAQFQNSILLCTFAKEH